MTQLQSPSPPFPFSTSPPTRPILTICQLTFGYLGHPPILDDISFSVATGEKVGLIGPNGAGKTSLFMTICGILPLTRGQITLFDQPITPGEFRPELGFVFQNPDDQLFSATVEADVAFGPENMGFTPDEVAARTEAALTLTGMFAHKDRPPHHLSGGEKRMVAIASVLSMLPQLIIYDEPSANLDLRARRRLIQFLQHSQETILVSSHDLEFLLEVCDRVLLLDNGHIIADGFPSSVMGDEELMLAHGLEKPHSLIPHALDHDGNHDTPPDFYHHESLSS
ncbi:MAG: energy-coupling factor ABC transporter ATP-binding protein [Merismopedia sp. SIO2A8]|nr:energy-coupling factor ABC transporter ATP-binding protein [Merismopedia sp. SIO2A8]